jgi:hypothetical protein
MNLFHNEFTGLPRKTTSKSSNNDTHPVAIQPVCGKQITETCLVEEGYQIQDSACLS